MRLWLYENDPVRYNRERKKKNNGGDITTRLNNNFIYNSFGEINLQIQAKNDT
jgi:hypothetical protein